MKKNMVLLIPRLRHGGAERVVSHLSRILNRDFNIKIVVFDDTMVTYDFSGELVSMDLPLDITNNIFKKLINLLKRLYQYNKYKKRNNINVTYSFGDAANIVNVLSFGDDQKIISIRGFRGIRQGKTFIDKIIFKPISKLITLLADKVVAVSNLIKNTLISEYNLNSEKIYTIHNGYDINEIEKKSRESLTDDEKLIFDKPVIITAGTFRIEKGYWHLLKSFKVVVEKNRDVQLVILGNDYKNYKKKVLRLANDLDINNNIHLLGYAENPYKYFANSDVYALSSVFEGFPNALVEAMACGLPVVANDCQSGPREILAPDISVKEKIETTILAEYGILTPRFSIQENFDTQIITENEIEYSNQLLSLIEDYELNYKYRLQSLNRTKDFSLEAWKEIHKKVINS